MTAGRKKKSDLIKLIEGNPSRQQLASKAQEIEWEPICEVPPTKPHIVGADALASAEWDRLLSVVKEGHITAADETTLASYCLLWAMSVRAAQDIQERGQVIDTPVMARRPGGVTEVVGFEAVPNPSLKIWDRVNNALIRYQIILQLNPAKRPTPPVNQNAALPPETKSKFEGLLGTFSNVRDN